MKFRLAVGSVLLLVIAYALNSTFLWTALIDSYQATEISRFLIPIHSASDTIGNSLGNSKKRMTISDFREVMESQRQAILVDQKKLYNTDPSYSSLHGDDLLNLSIVLKSGSKLVSTTSEDKESNISPELVEQISRLSNGLHLADEELIQYDGVFNVPQLLYDDNGRWIGSVVFHFEKRALRHMVASKLGDHVIPTSVVGLLSIICILSISFLSPRGGGEFSKKKYIAKFLSIMICSLICSLLVNTIIFQRQYLEVSKDNAHEIANQIYTKLNSQPPNQNIQKASDKQQIDLGDYINLFDHFEAITLTDLRGTPYYKYRTGRSQLSESESIVQDLLLGHLSTKQFWVSEKSKPASLESGLGGTTVIYISRKDILTKSLSLIINGLTILLITILVMVELLLLYMHWLIKNETVNGHESRYELGFVRPAMFFFLFGIDLSMSFLPLHVQSLDTELLGLSEDLIAGLPISSEFFCVGVFILVAGVWMDRRGWHEPFFAGLFIVGMGTLWSWAAIDAIQFILSRAIVGIGYGLTLMSAQGFVINLSGQRGRATGLSNLFAGLYSGSICGAATGAILAERFGYEKVFFFGAVVVFALILYAWGFMRAAIDQPRPDSDTVKKPDQSIKMVPLLKFLGNPTFIALSLLSSLPASVAVAGFINYFTPVYLDGIGAKESTIGQVLILYGICLIFFGPAIGRLIDRSKTKQYYMLAGGLLGGLAFATFDTSFGVASVVFSVFLLGISSSFVLSSQSTIVLELEESRVLGEGKAIGIFRSISRIGQVIGPMIFGWVLLSGDLTDVINYLGIFYIAAMLVLAFFVKKPTEHLGNERATL